MMRRLICAALGLSVWSLATTAAAAEPPGTAEFNRGRAALAAGDREAACALFEESYKLYPAPGTLLNVAACEEHHGKLMVAAEHFRLAAAGFPKNAPGRTEASRRAQELEAALGKVTVRRAASLPAQARVSLGGRELTPSEFEQPLPVDPGRLELEVELAGHERGVQEVDVPRGGALELVAQAGPERAVTSPQATAPTEARSEAKGSTALRVGGIVGMGLGVASLAVGAVTGVLALGEASTYRDHCRDNRCDERGMDAANSLKTLSPLSTVGFIAGGVLAAGGLTMVLIAPRMGKRQSPQALQLAPALGPKQAGMSLHFTF